MSNSSEGKPNFEKLSQLAATVFTPSAPIAQRHLFADRPDQVRQVVDAINQTGQHVIVFGERGVGKTSLVNLLADFLKAEDDAPVLTPRVTCTTADTYADVWRQVFLVLQRKLAPAPGFRKGRAYRLRIPQDFNVHSVVDALHEISAHCFIVVVLDEFDRLTSQSDRSLFADTIKALSDDPCRATVVLVGVADTVQELVADHQSIERALAQVRMPRMSADELRAIVTNGLEQLGGMAIGESTLTKLVTICQGMPHYAHVLGLASARQALDERKSLKIGPQDFSSAMETACTTPQATILRGYYDAVYSQRRESLYAEVLLACAITPRDEMGFFLPGDVREPMTIVRRAPVQISDYNKHLVEFTRPDRGPALQRMGAKRRYRYRFADPLLQPYVVMKGLTEGRISRLEVAGSHVAPNAQWGD